MSSEEISSTEDLITPERLAKGDLMVAKNLRGKISHAIPNNLTIIKELIRRRVFPHHYEVYGVGFLELRQSFLSPWAARSAAILTEQWGVGVSNGRGCEIYQNVCKALGEKRILILRFVLGEGKEKEDRNAHPVYRECFEYLVSLMDEERDRVLAELGYL